MIRRRLCYLLLVVLSAYFIMLYDFQGLRFLAVCVVLIPLLYLLVLIPQVFLCSVSLKAERDTVCRGDEIKIVVTIENRGFLPVAGCFIRGRFRGPGEENRKIGKQIRGIRGRYERRTELIFPAVHCGRGEFELSGVRACDFFGIFSLPVRVRQEQAVLCVMPVLFSVSREEINPAALHFRQWNSAGDGDTVVRDFRSGDSMHRVYWKLSAKTDQLQVRDFEGNDSVTFFLSALEDLQDQAGQWDSYLDRALSLICFLLENEKTCLNILWTGNRELYGCEACSTEDALTWIYQLLLSGEAGESLHGEAEAFFGLMGGFCLKEDGRLYLGEQCIYE